MRRCRIRYVCLKANKKKILSRSDVSSEQREHIEREAYIENPLGFISLSGSARQIPIL
jgi:hypothetical protein